MIAEYAYDLGMDDLFLKLDVEGADRFFLKIEGLNPAGSIKVKAARGMIEALEMVTPDMSQVRLIESTSGNLGVALAVICATKKYPLTLVTDPNTNSVATSVMRALGAEVVTVTERDANGGFLGTRIDYINKRLADEPKLHWLNQYSNPNNPASHERYTAPGILRAFGKVDQLFIGVGTGGTLIGCLAYFRRWSPATRIIAVDAVGSVNFSSESATRYIPGLGTSRRPEILDAHQPDEVMLIPEWETIRECRWLATETGMIAGGSTGTVLAAVRRRAAAGFNGETVVAIAPDIGERYLNSVFDDEWVNSKGLGKALTEPVKGRQIVLV